MGRPPIGKSAMTDAERMRRYRLKHGKGKPVTKPVTKPAGPDHDVLVQELAQARARIADAAAEIAVLKAELARERKQREAAEAKHLKPGGNVDDEAAAGGPMGKKVFKILLKLDDANDNTVLVAARKLVGDLKASGSDLRTLADAMGAAWEKEQKAKPAPPPDIDFSAVEDAITRYTADRTTVNFNRMWKAVVVEVPALDKAVRAGHRDSGEHIVRYFQGYLGRLGFTGSSSGRTWSR
jgi:uncharacterized small protein (DUF1192 family)